MCRAAWTVSDSFPRPLYPEEVYQERWRSMTGVRAVSEEGRSIVVLDPGRISRCGGPDFRGARIVVDGELRLGDVEIHGCPADWRRHGHDRDPAYLGVVLQVAAVRGRVDEPCRTVDGRTIPTLVLEGLRLPGAAPGASSSPADAGVLGRCEIAGGWDRPISDLLSELGRQRMAGRVARWRRALAADGWGEALWRGLLDGLGFGPNRVGFLELGRRLSWPEASAHLSRWATEERAPMAAALLLGAAGLLEPGTELDGDPRRAFLRRLWDALAPTAPAALSPAAWRTGAVRPANRPSRRLLALAGYLARGEGLLFRDTATPNEPASPHVLAARLSAEAALWSARPQSSLAVPGPDDVLGAQRIAALLGNVFLPALAARDGSERAFEDAATAAASLPEIGLESLLREASRRFGRALGSTPETALRKTVSSFLLEDGLLALWRSHCLRGAFGCAECPGFYSGSAEVSMGPQSTVHGPQFIPSTEAPAQGDGHDTI